VAAGTVAEKYLCCWILLSVRDTAFEANFSQRNKRIATFVGSQDNNYKIIHLEIFSNKVSFRHLAVSISQK